MPRKAYEAEINELQRVLGEHPGHKGAFFARLLGWSREKVSRRLVTLNDQGDLFFEDDQGRLYPFDSTLLD